MPFATSNRTALFALMLVLFIDGLGQGIIFPILTHTITDLHSNAILHHASQHTRDIWYGVLVAVYFLMWFLGAALLGDWSDSVGRKKALLLCLSLAAAGFLLSALAFQIKSLYLLLFARFIGGLTSGDQAIAQASVVDLCPPEKKPAYLGLVLLSVTLGLVVGPLIGAYLINTHMVSWFSIKTPFYFAVLLTVVNIVLLKHWYKETKPVVHKKKLQITRAVHIFLDAFKHRTIRILLCAYILGQLGWAMFYVFTPNFLALQYQLDTNSIGWFLALIGAGLGIGLGLLPSYITTHNHKVLVIIGYAIMLVASLIFTLDRDMLVLWCIVVPGTAALGLAYANLLTLFSESVSSERQGWIMGVTGSVVALTAGIDSLISGFLAGINVHAPYVYAVITFALSLILLIFFYKHHKYKPASQP